MSEKKMISVVVLAAGKGTRMKSDRAKVLHDVFFRPMVHHVLMAVEPMSPARTLVIVGHQEDAVRRELAGFAVGIVRQEKQLGTGHAVLMTRDHIPEDEGLVMILCGDTPLIRTQSLTAMSDHHVTSGSDLTVMTTIVQNPTGYGRIISRDGTVTAIVEEKDADADQKKINEINAGIYLVRRKLLFDALASITPDNSQGELYLTDIVAYSVSRNMKVNTFLNATPMEVLGVNSRVELDEANMELQSIRNRELMLNGVSIQNSPTIAVSPFSIIGMDTVLKPGVTVEGNSAVGGSCEIGNGAIIRNSRLGNRVKVGAYSIIDSCDIDDYAIIEPFSHFINKRLD